jgi:hypothetical protein
MTCSKPPRSLALAPGGDLDQHQVESEVDGISEVFASAFAIGLLAVDASAAEGAVAVSERARRGTSRFGCAIP